MGKKVNVYLDSKTLKLWGDIPSGQRSSIIKEAIRNNSIKKPVDPKTEMINMKLVKLEKVNMEMEQLIKQKLMLEDELNNLKSGEEILNISKDDFWNKIEKRGFTYLENKSVYHSYSGKSRYSIFDISEGKIFIKNIRTGRTNSNFSKRTTDIAIDRLIAHGGKVLVGQFIPVKMHEFTVVALHPRLITKDGWVCWLDENTIPVQEDMIPDNDSGDKPPKEWVSNDTWLAVMVDGKRAHACFASPGWSGKIVLEFIDEHPTMGDGLWMTKYFRLLDGDGILYWGHKAETQKLVTKSLGGE
jgi:hypothetical protein